MAKFVDYEVNTQITDMMEKILEKFPSIFEGFDINKVQTVITKGKKNKRGARLTPVKYPFDILIDKVYFIEVFEETWNKFTEKQRELALFRQMVSIPDGGFDTDSPQYGKKRKPDFECYAEEFAVTNGVPNWEENDDARGVTEAADFAKKTGQDVTNPVVPMQAALKACPKV